jgi:hypothetical protein
MTPHELRPHSPPTFVAARRLLALSLTRRCCQTHDTLFFAWNVKRAIHELIARSRLTQKRQLLRVTCHDAAHPQTIENVEHPSAKTGLMAPEGGPDAPEDVEQLPQHSETAGINLEGRH